MNKIFISVVLMLASNISYAQTTLGLICKSESETIPRMLRIDLAAEAVLFFDLGRATWLGLSGVTITDSEISAYRYASSRAQNTFSINRLEGTWESATETSFMSGTEQNGICISRPEIEMEQIAQDQLELLNQRRAF
jgi:hypothetical protein